MIAQSLTLEALGVTHIVVDSRGMRPDVVAQIANVRELTFWGTDENLVTYLVK